MRSQTLTQKLDSAHRWWLVGMFLYAVAHLIVLRGVNPGVLLMFLVPPLTAMSVAASPRATPGGKRVAKSFLACIGLAVAIGTETDFLPHLNGNVGVPNVPDRILTLYAGVYIFFFLGVLPPFLFGRSLRKLRRREPAEFSRFTCHLGLLTWGLMLLAMLGALPQLIRAWM